MTKNTNDSLDICISTIVRLKSIFVLLLSLLLIIECCNGMQSLNNHDADDCPVYCTCYIWYRLTWASCAGKRLVNVHTGVSKMVQALDLSNNSISKLEDFEFATMGLHQLKYLNLSDNAISEISLFAFAQLFELTILDLSKNHFDYLIPETFVDNNKLQIVKLSGNNFHRSVPYLESATITKLCLSGCQIGHLPSGIFNGLKRLRNLDLSNNIMIELDIGILQALPYLRILRIDRNPWLCNNAMRALKIFLTSRAISYNTICEEETWHSHNPIRKFERMMKQNTNDQKMNERSSQSILLPVNIEDGNKSWNNSTIEPTELPTDSNDGAENPSSVIMNLQSSWFFVTGFIVGCSVGMISIYIWLSRHPNSSSQQFTLLDNMSSHSDTTLPTYCEVMLHSNRYPHI